MSFSKPPVVASSVALLAALSLVPLQGWARDGRRAGENLIYEIPAMSSNAAHDVIFEMAPLKPAKGAAQTAKSAPKPPQQPPAPAVAATPAPTIAAPSQPAEPTPAPVAEAPKPVEAPTPVAEAPMPAESQPPVAEAPPAAEPQLAGETLAAAPGEPVAVESSAPAETAAGAPAEAPLPPAQAAGEGATPAEAVAASEPVAPTEQTPVVEPAPVMTLNAPRKSVAALKAPEVFFDQHDIDLQGGSSAPTLVPGLKSFAQAPEPAPQVAEAEEADPAEAQQAEVETRIEAILAEGLVGPIEVRIADRATMWLPAGRVFIPRDAAKRLAEEAGLEWRPGVQGIVVPAGGELDWLAPVELLDDGYIKASDAGAMQPEPLLAAFEASLPEVNAQRAQIGQPPVALEGWLVAPAQSEKHRLAACVNVSTQSGQNEPDRFFNCEAWTLGRQVAIKVGLADAQEQAGRLKGEASMLADTIVFDRGQTYEEFDAASDKIAPYVTADLLTRDVGARNAAPVATAAEAAPASSKPAPSSLISSLFYPAAFGAAAVALYVWMKRRRASRKDIEAEAAVPAAERIEFPAPAKAEAQEPSTNIAPSLFARLLPTVHARFVRKPEPAPAPAAPETLAPEPAPKTEIATEKPQTAGLMGRLSSLRAAKKDDAKAALASAAPAPAARDPEEPLSKLRKLATKMRRATDEPPAPPVNVSRAIRPARVVLGGAAPAIVEHAVEPLVVEVEKAQEAEPRISLLEPQPVEPKAAPALAPAAAMSSEADEPAREVFAAPPAVNTQLPRPVLNENDFGLIEPGEANGGNAPRNWRPTDL